MRYRILEFAGVLGRLSYYSLAERSRRICHRSGLGHGYIAVDDDISFQCPASPVAHSVFRDMAFGGQGRSEIEEFLELGSGCRFMVDAGASGGFFSVLFAVSRREYSRLLSIEPDPGARAVLQDLRLRNRVSRVDWKIDSHAIGGACGQVELVSAGYGAESPSDISIANSRINAARNNLLYQTLAADCATLGAIAAAHEFSPDLIKIDIESAEHELIMSSLDLLARERPRIMLELHIAQLWQRGVDPAVLLQALATLGYRRLRRPSVDIRKLAQEADPSGVVRAGLIC